MAVCEEADLAVAFLPQVAQGGLVPEVRCDVAWAAGLQGVRMSVLCAGLHFGCKSSMRVQLSCSNYRHHRWTKQRLRRTTCCDDLSMEAMHFEPLT